MTRRTWGLLLPLAVAVAAAGLGAWLLTSASGQLPDKIAVHWGLDGTPDRFDTVGNIVATSTVLIVGIPALLALMGFGLRQAAALGGTAAGTSVYMAAILYGAPLAQRGTTDPTTYRLGNATMLLAMALGLAVGVGVGLLLRRPGGPWTGPRPATPPDAARLDVAPGSRVAWLGPLRTSRRVTTGYIALFVALVALGVVVGVASQMWFVLVFALPVGAFLPFMTADVAIDHEGVRVRVLDRFTLRAVPLDRVEVATTTKVSCLGDYGGWGYRGGFDGSWGFVTSDGPALRIARHDQPPFVLTIDDPEDAAAVLNTLVDRQATDPAK